MCRPNLGIIQDHIIIFQSEIFNGGFNQSADQMRRVDLTISYFLNFFVKALELFYLFVIEVCFDLILSMLPVAANSEANLLAFVY
jgi:hypothetical protein